MMREPPSHNRFQWRWQLRRFFTFGIRGKIILPYLILTLAVAVIGAYVVTSLVASSLDERLTNHLLEAGRVVSDMLVRHELSHLEAARVVAFTRGVAEALEEQDTEEVLELARPAAAGMEIENLIVVDAEGNEALHLLRRADGSFEVLEGEFDGSDLWTIQTLLEADDPEGVPRRAIGFHPADEQYYYFTAIPISLEDRLVGVVSVGTSLETLIPEFKSTSLADVTIYLDGGRAVASTFMFAEEPESELGGLEQFSISPEAYNETLRSTDITMGENIMIRGRWYRLARGSLQVGNEKLGVFSVALPSHFIISAGTTSRNTYTFLFALTAGAVIVVGYLISQRIITPLGRLVRTSKAVADGNLEQRTGIGSADEIGVLATTFDQMTERLLERTRALEELMQNYKEAAGRMRAILSSIGDGVLLEDLDGNLIPLNEVAEELLEELTENFQLGPLRDLTAMDVEQQEANVEEDGNPWLVESRRFEVGRKMISTHSAAVRTDDGERLGTVIVLRDVTAEVEAERLKDAFVAHVSHELRTPLTAIKGYIALLRTSAGDSLNKEELVFLDIVSRHTDNLVAMIDELLDFSEMEAKGRLGLRRKKILLSDLVQQIAKEWRPQMEEKELVFHVETPPGTPMIDADPRRLRWALINMVRNAWQYTPEGGEVVFRSSLVDGKVIFEIVDTGVGISSEDQKRIFDRFRRIDQDADDAVRGLGLGLYISNAIVEAHGGRIEIDSEEGVGSKFSVTLPTLHTVHESRNPD